MSTANEVLQDEAIRRHIDLQRYSNATVRKIIAVLNKADVELSRRIATAIDQGRDTATIEHLDAMLASVRALNAEAYRQARLALDADLKTFAAHESAQQLAVLMLAIPREVAVQISLAGTTESQVYAAAMARPFQGRLLREWMADMEADRARKIRDAIRIGITNNDTTETIVRSIRGSRAQNYADGLLERPRQDLETVVRTAINHTAAVAREQTAAANADILKGIVWVNTLDTRVCLLCATHGGEEYAIGTHKPLGPKKLPWLGGPGLAHFGCRCVSAPVLKSWRELGLSGLPEGTRASMDGQVPASMTYAEWLAKQPMDRVEDVLGPIRARLYRQGGLKLDGFVNDKGVLYTLDELRARDAAAFAKAGL
ncbi:MAG TPA: hypothetical protein VFP92_10810 [Rhodanobacteraceae bacterium]|nr:hypothetical protein [Rhodanobacteraceae bacterium]